MFGLLGQYLHMFPKVPPDAIAGVAQGPERPCLHFTYKKVLSSPSTRTDRPVGPHPLTSSMSVFLCPPVQVCCGWVLLSRPLGANCIAESVLKVSFGDWHPGCRPFPGNTPSLIVSSNLCSCHAHQPNRYCKPRLDEAGEHLPPAPVGTFTESSAKSMENTGSDT